MSPVSWSFLCWKERNSLRRSVDEGKSRVSLLKSKTNKSNSKVNPVKRELNSVSDSCSLAQPKSALSPRPLNSKGQCQRYFYPGCTSLTRQQLFSLPWHLHLVSRLRMGPQIKKKRKKGEKTTFFSEDTAQSSTGGFQRPAISIWPWGQRYHYNSLSWAPVLHSLKVRPHPPMLRWNAIFFFFMMRIKSPFSPLPFSQLPRLRH